MYKTVKEVCELTGLTRKLLFDYEEMEIVMPSGYSTRGYIDSEGKEYNGYKLYDEEAVMKLQLIAMYKNLGLKRAEIKKRITADDYDCIRILDEQIEMLRREKEEIENKILLAEQLKILGLKNKYIQGRDVSILVENTKNWQNSSYYKEMEKMLETAVPSDEYRAEMTKVFEQLASLHEAEYELDKAKGLLEILFRVNTKEFGIAGFFFILGIALGAEGDGILGKEIEEQLKGYPIESVANLIINYFPEFLLLVLDLCDERISEFSDVIGNDYADSKVKELASKVDEVLLTYFGVSREFEYDMLIEALKWIETEIGQELDPKFIYTLEAIKYYRV